MGLTAARGRRQEGPRLSRRLDVTFGTGGSPNAGLIHNISPVGMGMFTPVVYPPGSVFEFTVTEAGEESVTGRAEVRWNRLLATRRASLKYEMSARILDPQGDWSELFGRIRAEHERSLADEKLKKMLPLRFTEPADTAPLVNGYVLGSGAWISVDDEPRRGWLVSVRVELPELTDDVYAIGRISEVRHPNGEDPGGVGARYLRMIAGLEAQVKTDLSAVEARLGVPCLFSTHLSDTPES